MGDLGEVVAGVDGIKGDKGLSERLGDNGNNTVSVEDEGEFGGVLVWAGVYG